MGLYSNLRGVLGDFDLSKFSLKGARAVGFSSVPNNPASGAAATIDFSTGAKQAITLTASCTLTFVPPAGVCQLTLLLSQDPTGGRLVVWPASVKWPAGQAPDISPLPTTTTIVSMFYDGSTFYALGLSPYYQSTNIVADGDSITFGTGTSPATNYPLLASADYLPTQGSTSNIGVPGETFATMVTNFNANVAPLIASAHARGWTSTTSCFAGTNDIFNGSTAAAVFASATSYFGDCVAAGADWIIGWTILPRNDGGETTRQAFNTSMRSGFAGIGCKLICDVGNDPSMGNAANLTNTTLYQSDQIHPTNFGQQILANYFAAAVLRYKSSCTVSSCSPGTGSQAGGTAVTIHGTGFTGTLAVVLGGIQATGVTVVSDTTITATSGVAFGAGVADVFVIGKNGAGILAGGWTYT